MEVRVLRHLWKAVSIAALVAFLSSGAWAANKVEVVSQIGVAPSALVEVSIKLENDTTLRGIIVPLVVRQVGEGGPTVTQMAMRYRDRLPFQGGAPLSGLIATNRFDSETGTCKDHLGVFYDGGFLAPPQQQDTLAHPVTSLPVCGLFVRNSIFPATPLVAGSDATGSLVLQLQLSGETGCILIDSTCADPANHVSYVKMAGGNAKGMVFQSGAVCIGDCAIPAIDQASLAPADNEVDADTMTFSWDPVPGASSYTIQIGFDANMSNLIEEAEVDFPQYDFIVPPGGLLVYWRVRANLADQCSSDYTNSYKYTDVKNVAGDVVPVSYKLSQNYPNPFNAGTVIDFTLRNSGHVKLEVFNILGQSVITLVDGEKPAGIYSVEWDGQNARGQSVPSGMYFYRLNTDRFTDVKKMTLLK